MIWDEAFESEGEAAEFMAMDCDFTYILAQKMRALSKNSAFKRRENVSANF